MTAPITPDHQRPTPASSAQASPLPTTGRAAVRHVYGGPELIRTLDVPVPTPGPDQVLLRVRAAGLDRGVWHLMTGLPYAVRVAGYGVARPKQPVLGSDVAGTVVAVGSGVDGFEVGDEVFGIADGSFAEYAVADTSRIAHRPADVGPVAAAVASASGITALQALTDVGGLEPGQRVLVVGASGGVGSFAVQLAVALGARVTGVASSGKADMVRGLGADHVVAYDREDPFDGSATYDLIVDTGGGTPVKRLRRALARTGTLVIVGGEGGNRITGGVGRQMRAAMISPILEQDLKMFISAEDRGHVALLAEYLADGRVMAHVGATYRLDDVEQAIDDLTEGRIRGKAAIVIDAAAGESDGS